ncbi:cytochrome P450 [Nocardia brasiliensis]|uniref:Cytochrome P450 n=1 Tax=Nocardia brasiliensis TaxID=37326 RepID=A0A6G9XR10_NOCBR|nr:cytochrome P450 [Nocardia brasiliensis]QIS03263.1 cytochrome P450 [Nocardia brasiliensis]
MSECPFPFAWPAGLTQPDALLRAHQDPFRTVTLPSGDQAVLATRYQTIRTLLADPRISKDRNRSGVAKMTTKPQKVFQRRIDMSPPAHARMRRLIAREFTAARVETMRPRIAAIVTALLDRMADAGAAEPVDLNTAFAFPLSIQVICELLGVPARERHLFGDTSNPPWDYIRELIERKRRHPDSDLISALIAVTDAEDGRLSADELHFWSTLLLLAGYETTANQIAGAVVLLLGHPDQLALLRADPTLIDGAVEELLRCQVVGTSLSMLRYVTEDVTVGDHVIPQGTSIIPALECANHDPAVFTEPARLDLTRRAAKQLTFSVGRHFCPGAPLARAQLRLGIAALIQRFPELRLAVPTARLDRVDDHFFQGFRTVPVRW